MDTHRFGNSGLDVVSAAGKVGLAAAGPICPALAARRKIAAVTR